MNRALFQTGVRDDWETPPELFSALDSEFHFTLDPCCTPETAKCRRFYTKADDGLKQDWGGEIVFCNPPYSDKKSDPNGQTAWVRKCYEESKKPGTTVVALIPSRTDTERFHRYILDKAEIRFIPGRLRFVGAKDVAPFPSLIAIWRNTNSKGENIMATKKTNPADPTIEESPDILRSLNVHQKLLYARNEFLEGGLKKSGVNLHAEFAYFELVDIVPRAEPIFQKYGLLLVTAFTETSAVATVVNVDDPEQEIIFTVPLQLIAEPGKFRMNEVQGVGAAVTYYRRYLYMVVLDLVEADAIDSDGHAQKDSGENKSTSSTRKSSMPVSADKRKETKAELTESEAVADAGAVTELKECLKELLAKDPEQESFVQEIALRTDGFKNIKATACDALVENVKSMIEAYAEPEEE